MYVPQATREELFAALMGALKQDAAQVKPESQHPTPRTSNPKP